MRRLVDLLGRQPPRDVAHLLARVVAASVAREGFELSLDIVGGLAREPRSSDLMVEIAMAGAARRNIPERRTIDHDFWRFGRAWQPRQGRVNRRPVRISDR